MSEAQKPPMPPRLLLNVPDHEIDVGLDAGTFREAPAVLTQHPEGMRFVDQQIGAHLAFDRGDLGQRGHVAQHAVDALDHNQLLPRQVRQMFEPALEVFRVVVAEAGDGGLAQTGAVIDAGVAVGIQKQMVALSGQNRQHPGHLPDSQW